MGCGAVCGNNSSIYEPNQQSQRIMFQLIPQLAEAKDFISPKQYKSFMRQIKQNPLKYRLRANSKLISKQQIDPGILIKWKVILYCLNSSNTEYNNCLGQNPRKIQAIKSNSPSAENQQPEEEDSQNQFQFEIQNSIYRHKEFSQIEKDIDRTCDLPESKKKTFQNILKRITNHFPTMGYTQGINFIVGYLLMIGYSQFDAFWMFVHIAINRRYLLLGLFEDGFPLSDIYKTIFKNILKRENNQLYQHLYINLNIDEAVWVFKWFFTYFIYSFPHQMIRYVFDVVIEIGGLGLISFAVAITQQLSKQMLEETDVCQMSIFFQSLRDINVFNQYINIDKVVQRAYKLQIKKEDFQGVNLKTNFYSEYILATLDQRSKLIPELSLEKIEKDSSQPKSKKKIAHQTKQLNRSDQLLIEWYKRLLDQRKQFTFKHRIPQGKDKNKKNIQRISIENAFPLPKDQNIQEKIVKSPEQDQNSVNQNKNSYKDSTQLKNDTIPSTGYSFNKKSSRMRGGEGVSQIDELWDEEDRNSSISKNMSSKMSQQSRTQNGFKQKIRKNSYEDELDKLAATSNNALGKTKFNYNKCSSIFSSEKHTSFRPKINNFHIKSERSKGNNLMRAAEQILTNISITQNSQHESSQSQCSKFSQKQKKQKQNGIYSKPNSRVNNPKIYDIQNQDQASEKKSINQQNSSEVDSYIDPQNSFYVSNESIQDETRNSRNSEIQAYSVKVFQSHRQRVSTQQDILTSSLHISQIKQGSVKVEILNNGSEIQIFQAQQVFKKKNRVSSRINGAIKNSANEALKIQKLNHKISEGDMLHKGQKSFKTILAQVQINYQESCESLFVPSQGNRSNIAHYKQRSGENVLNFQQQLQKCQIESVK